MSFFIYRTPDLLVPIFHREMPQVLIVLYSYRAYLERLALRSQSMMR